MKQTLLRILLHGLIAAALLAVCGYGLASLGGMYLTLHTGVGRNPGGNDPVADELRYRLPLGMAFWGFVLVVVMELLLAVVRRSPPAATPPAPPAPSTQQILDDLLRKAEADAANPAAPCPPAPPADNTPGSP